MKKLRKILLSIVMAVMVFGTCLTAQAAPAIKYDTMKSITVKENGKSVSSVTIYTQDDPKVLDVEYVYTDKQELPDNYVEVKTSDRSIVKVDWVENPYSAGGKGSAKLQLTATGNGKAKVTIADKMNKKKKVINVTVKTYADEITFGEIVEGDMAFVAAGGKVNLGAAVNADASDKKLTFKKDPSSTKNLSVDSKGNVKISANAGDLEEVGKVIVTANGSKNKSETVTVKIMAIKDPVTKIDPGVKTLNLKGNLKSASHSVKLDFGDVTYGYDDLNFVSSNTKVATVDEDGVITAGANGSAKITITSKKGAAKAATVTVKVTTDPELVSVPSKTVELIADGKVSAKIGASINANANNKSVKYAIISVIPKDGEEILYSDATKKEIGTYISLSSSGVVKAKKSCDAVVKAYSGAKGFDDVYTTVNVTAYRPVTGIKIEDEESDVKLDAKKKATVVIHGEDDWDNLDLNAVPAGDPDNGDVVWTSSNKKVAIVDEEGVVTPVANGTAKITATAVDGSKKKDTVTVTVKTDAYEINVPKADDYDTVYVELTTKNTGKSISASSILGAYTNKNASNKGIVYNPTKVTAKATEGTDEDPDQVVTITSKDGKAERKITVKFIGNDEVAKEFTITLDTEDQIALLAGEKLTVNATIEAVEGEVTTVPVATWKSDNTSVAKVSKTGEITAVKPGVATITASYAGAEPANLKVYVGQKQADVTKTVNTYITNKVKEENRDWTGVNTKFNSSTNTFALTILDPNKDINSVKDTGLTAALEGLQNIGYSFNVATIKDEQSDISWTAVREGSKVTVNDVAYDNYSDAISAIMQESIEGKELLRDWNGKEYTICARAEWRDPIVEGEVFYYDLDYTVTTSMAAATYDSMLDGVIADGVDSINAQLEGLGIENVTYDAATNTFKVVADEADQGVYEAYEKAEGKDAESQIDKLAGDILTNATSVTASFSIGEYGEKGKDTVTRDRNGRDDDYAKDVVRSYIEKLSSKGKTYADIDPSSAKITVTFVNGTQTYEISYYVYFSLTEDARPKKDNTNAASVDAVAEPTVEPTEEPTAEPTETPAEETPSEEPTEAPADEPSEDPEETPAETPAETPEETPAEGEPAETPSATPEVEEPAEETAEAVAEAAVE